MNKTTNMLQLAIDALEMSAEKEVTMHLSYKSALENATIDELNAVFLSEDMRESYLLIFDEIYARQRSYNVYMHIDRDDDLLKALTR